MRYKLSEHKDEIITHLIKNLIWVPVAALIPVGVSFIKSVYVYLSCGTDSSIWSMILLLIAMSILIVLIPLLSTSKKQTYEKIISSKFRAKSMVATMVFTDRENIRSQIAYDMDILENNVMEICRSITWTGTTYKQTTLINKDGNYSIEDSKRKSSPHDIKILFNGVKNAGDSVKFTTKTEVSDENHDMVPRYTFKVKYQIDELVLSVVAPAGLIKNVKKSVYSDTVKDINLEPPTPIEVEIIGDVVRYTYKITNPTFLYRYFIEWEFTD